MIILDDFLILYDQRKLQVENIINVIILNEKIKKSFHPLLYSAVKYTLNAGGKRFRPVITLSSYLAGGRYNLSNDILFLASAVELIHTYSLIHDDLPSMDNDDFRRGIPTCHKAYSESTAILAGDALNAYAFYLVSQLKLKDGNTIKDLLSILHDGAGGPGMISGQIEDIDNEKNPVKKIKTLERIHNLKTGALIQSSMLMGNRLRNDYKKRESSVKEYANKLGLLFQITDDILDIEGTREELGKTPGKDSKSEKLTFPSLYGMDKSKKMADRLKSLLVRLAKKLESDNEIFFKTLPEYIVRRKN